MCDGLANSYYNYIVNGSGGASCNGSAFNALTIITTGSATGIATLVGVGRSLNKTSATIVSTSFLLGVGRSLFKSYSNIIGISDCSAVGSSLFKSSGRLFGTSNFRVISSNLINLTFKYHFNDKVYDIAGNQWIVVESIRFNKINYYVLQNDIQQSITLEESQLFHTNKPALQNELDFIQASIEYLNHFSFMSPNINIGQKEISKELVQDSLKSNLKLIETKIKELDERNFPNPTIFSGKKSIQKEVKPNNLQMDLEKINEKLKRLGV